jgi:hypothetical protein
MQASSTRIAYLKRMLKRLEDAETRLRDLVVAGELTLTAEELGAEQVRNSRAELLAELKSLEN